MLTLNSGHVPFDVPTLGPNGGPQEAVRGMDLSVRERSRINGEPRISQTVDGHLRPGWEKSRKPRVRS